MLLQKIKLTLFLTCCMHIFSPHLSSFEFCCDCEPACWQGVYLSGQLGGGWSRTHAKFVNPNYFNTLGNKLLGSHFHFKSNKFIGGAALGYNYQMGCVVVGVEAGVLNLDLKDRRPSPFFPDVDVYSSKLQWLTNAKVRAGFAYQCLLTFVTAGWAGGNVSLLLDDTEANVRARSKHWTNGWTVGAGADYKISSCFSLGLAYDYMRLTYDKQSISCSRCGTGVGFGTPRVNSSLEIQAFTVRLNYIYKI